MYAGNYEFDHDNGDDFADETYGGNIYCKCCGKRYTPGYMDSEGDGDVPYGIHTFGMPAERECNCTEKDLRMALESRGEEIELDWYGDELFAILSQAGKEPTDMDICKMSEHAGKEFSALVLLPVDVLLSIYSAVCA